MNDLSSQATEVGTWMAAQCENGLPKSFGDDLASAFPQSPKNDLREALAELAEDGYVDLHHVIGPALPRVRVRPELLFEFNFVAYGTSPEDDAQHLASLLLNNETMGQISKLHSATGWEYRRFNPALLYLLQHFDEGRYSQELQNEYATRYLIIGPTERMRLKRMLKA